MVVAADGPAKRPVDSRIPHLDGLRTLALAGVLGFHFDVPRMQGGYVGVDCFLVLSGYLMTRKILRDLGSGRFALRPFYVSRFWRLLPAAAVTVLTTVVLAWAAFGKLIVLRAARSGLAGLFFVSNIYFFKTSNYFDVDARLKPLLHMWSLSLEEQFYLVYPPSLMLLSAIGLSDSMTGVAIFLISAASYALNIAFGRDHGQACFFLLPTRLFEFGLGAITYIIEAHSIQAPAVMRELAPFSGLAAITSSFFILQGSTSPVHYALPAAVGMALLIHSSGSKLSHFFSTFYLAWLGRVTYSTYLVHWPIFVFASQFALAYPDLRIMTSPYMLMALSVTFGAILQRTIEDPCRRSRPVRLVSAIAVLTLSSCLILATPWGATWLHNKQPIDVFGQYKDVQRQTCVYIIPKGSDAKLLRGVCIVGLNQSGFKPLAKMPEGITTVLIGSSYATHMVGGLHKLALKHQRLAAVHATVGCPLSAEVGNVLSEHGNERVREDQEGCKTENRRRWAFLRRMPANSTVVVGDVLVGHATDRALALAKSIALIGLHPVILAPPPGSRSKFVYPCFRFRSTPLGRVMANLPGSECATLSEPAHSFDIDDSLMKLGRDHSDLLNVSSTFGALCDRTKGLCRHVDTATNGLLYDSDGWHWSGLGSYTASDMYNSLASYLNWV